LAFSGEDDLVEGRLHVQHHRVQAAAGGRVDPGHGARGVVEGLDAHRLRQPAGGVDGEDDDLAAALGSTQRESRGGRGLADAAGAAAHDDAGGGVVEEGVHVEPGRRTGVGGQWAHPALAGPLRRAHASPWSRIVAARS
jgi:hypothetical protein